VVRDKAAIDKLFSNIGKLKLEDLKVQKHVKPKIKQNKFFSASPRRQMAEVKSGGITSQHLSDTTSDKNGRNNNFTLTVKNTDQRGISP